MRAGNAAYVLSYFTAAAEALHLASSVDGLTFTPLNNGQPVLWGTQGSRTLRDPFIGRTDDGVYHLVATDGWSSTSIVHTSSRDLLTWSPQHLLPVMAKVDGAVNAWAPEFFQTPGTDTVHMIWSSVVHPRLGGQVWYDTGQDQRIWSTTTDFVTVEPPSLFFDPGYSVIDATVAKDGDGFLMAFKDERGDNFIDTAHKNIRLTRFTTPGGGFAELSEPVTPSPVEGPTLFRRDQDWILLFDHFLEGHYGAVVSQDGHSWQPVPIHLPPGVRHASVLSLAEPHSQLNTR